MKAHELDKILKWLFTSSSRLRNVVSCWAALTLAVVLLVYGGYTISTVEDEDFKYISHSENSCLFKDEAKHDTWYFHDKGYRPDNERGECNGRGKLIRPIDVGLHAEILKVGSIIALAPFLLVLLNSGVLGFRVAARQGYTAVKTSAVKQLLSAHKSRRETESKLHKAEARSVRMERDLDKAQNELDRLLNS